MRKSFGDLKYLILIAADLLTLTEKRERATRAMAMTALIDAGLTDLLFVSFRVFQLFEIVGVVDLEDENPPLTVGFAVD